MKKRIHFLFLLLLAVTIHLKAQRPQTFEYAVEAGATAGNGDYAPLWLTANRYGLSSICTENGYVRAGMKYAHSLRKHWDLEAGADLAAAYNSPSSFVLQQAYVDLSFYWLKLSVGSKERLPELKNPKLSSGGMVESNNARPVPQIRLGIPRYIGFPFTHNWLQLRGHIAYGAFTDGNWQKDFAQTGQKYARNVLYHSKSLFFKVGKKDVFPLEFELGMQMSAQFGGAQYEGGREEVLIDMPNRLSDFFRVLIPSAGDSTTPEGEQMNVYGNHVGSWNFALTTYLKEWKLRIYYEHYFEDHSQMFLQYGPWKDGHLGVEITFPKNRIIDCFVYETLATKDQTGPFMHDFLEGGLEEQVSGNDNYYNHSIYLSGWQHWGMGMGNPLLPGPIYNRDGALGFASNRALGHHVGLSGTPTPSVSYRMLLSYARHWGTYDSPFDEIKKQFNSLLEVTYRPQALKGWSFSLSAAMDRGNLLGNNCGGTICIRKEGAFKLR